MPIAPEMSLGVIIFSDNEIEIEVGTADFHGCYGFSRIIRKALKLASA
jgi:hypothetical protein